MGIVVLLMLWEFLPRMNIVDKNFLPPFSVVIATFWKILLSGELVEHIFVSLKRSVAGFFLGIGLSVPLGFVVGWFKQAEFYIDPIIQLCRQTSTLALLPVFMLVFGIGELSKVAIVFWGVWSAILLNTINGVKGVDPLLIKAAKSMGSSQLTIFYKVVFPAALPSIITGIRLSATSSILVLIAAEMMGASSGLGYLLMDTQLKYLIPKMYAAIMTMSLIGIIVNYVIVFFEKKVSRWRRQEI
ncbi:MAG: putative transporter permease protein [Sporomusa sp.]|nr:putative transporter permease protein [Sporomusa sp.]